MPGTEHQAAKAPGCEPAPSTQSVDKRVSLILFLTESVALVCGAHASWTVL